MISFEGSVRLRGRRVPYRVVGDQVLIARPSDGIVIALNPTTAQTWAILDEWIDLDAVHREFALMYPSMAPGERRDGVTASLSLLQTEGLLERSE